VLTWPADKITAAVIAATHRITRASVRGISTEPDSTPSLQGRNPRRATDELCYRVEGVAEGCDAGTIALSLTGWFAWMS
jgi:hypothetical protein